MKAQVIDANQVNMVNDTNCLVFDWKKMKGKVMLEAYNQMKQDVTESDTVTRVEDQIESKLGVSVGKGPASASISNSNKNSVIQGKKAQRKDEVVEMPIQKVNFITTKFHSMCSDEFISICRACSENDVDWFASQVGVFFATECQIGGLIRSTYKVAMTKIDTVNSVSLAVEASVSQSGAKMGPSAEITKTTNKSNEDQEIEFTCKALGGDVTIWGKFAETQDDQAALQNEWAKSITENSVGFNHQLRPLWELVRHFNPTFADAMETQLKRKWEIE